MRETDATGANKRNREQILARATIAGVRSYSTCGISPRVGLREQHLICMRDTYARGCPRDIDCKRFEIQWNSAEVWRSGDAMNERTNERTAFYRFTRIKCLCMGFGRRARQQVACRIATCIASPRCHRCNQPLFPAVHLGSRTCSAGKIPVSQRSTVEMAKEKADGDGPVLERRKFPRNVGEFDRY